MESHAAHTKIVNLACPTRSVAGVLAHRVAAKVKLAGLLASTALVGGFSLLLAAVLECDKETTR